MNSKKVRRTIGLIILMLSLALLVWGVLPIADTVRTLPITPQDMQLPDTEGLFLQAPYLV